MALAFACPAGWEELDEATLKGSFLDSDFCVIARPNGGVERYICGLLCFHVPKIDAEFRFVVWLSVSEPSWHAYRAGFGGGHYPAPGCFAYLMNEIPDFEGSFGLTANVWFQPDGLRPIVELHDGDHALPVAQAQGIDISQVERWAATIHRGV
jgi:hypothetical protein